MSKPESVSPDELADIVRPVLPQALIAFDVDGVLAPLVDHADESALIDGVHGDLTDLSALTEVAIVSGRSLESLERLFAFPSTLHVIGSHGLETRGVDAPELDDDEQYTFEQLEIIGSRGAEAAGPGAWLEYKPASVVLHTRTADPTLAGPAVDAVTNLAGMIDGATVKPGSNVVELLARGASKGTALMALSDRLARRPIVYLGDDVTDEEAFRTMGANDVSVRVGPGESSASYRLADATAAAHVLALLARS